MIFKVKELDVIIDDEDWDLISKFNWNLVIKVRTPYIQTSYSLNGKRVTSQLSRLILKANGRNVVDHINGNTLDNRKTNLRITDNRGNAQNMNSNINTTSKYKGVSWDKTRSKWRATIKYNGKQVFLGRFYLDKDAAIEYNKAASLYFGEYARLNPITVEISK